MKYCVVLIRRVPGPPADYSSHILAINLAMIALKTVIHWQSL